MRATKAIINIKNLKYNIAEVKKKLDPGVKLCIPVKADAYGHGALQVAIAAIEAGTHALAVASIQEGIELRNAGIVSPILSLSIPTLSEIDEILLYDIHPLVMDTEFIRALNERAKALNTVGRVHLKIDTGMNRIGCNIDEAKKIAFEIANMSNLKLQGIASHFSVSDSTNCEHVAFTKNQIEVFKKAIFEIKEQGIDTGLIHTANSGAVLSLKEAHFDMVRPGILVYGFTPSPELKGLISLKPVMKLVTQVVLIKKISKGMAVSYGCRWKAEKDTYIGTLPIGYADGLSRLLSNRLKVKIGNKFYPIVGSICMDQCMIDLGEKLEVNRWDEVEIFGYDETSNTAETLASLCETISYEIISNINKRVPRVYIENSER